MERGKRMRVKYVGKRPTYQDSLYGTGQWEKDQTKDVPSEVAKKMFRHPDQYVAAMPADEETVPPPEETEVVEVVETPHAPKEDEDGAVTAARDLVASMDKDQLDAYVMTNFRLKLHHSLTVENARKKAIMLIDQFGLS
jgi:hypothetical protein